MKKNLVPLLGIAFVVAILATGLFYGLFIGRLRNASSHPAQSLVVATRVVDRGSVLTANDLRLSPWPGEVPKGAQTDPGALVGQTVLESLQEGELLLAPKVAANAAAGGLVPAGMRAVSVHVADSAGIIAILRPGSRVDVQVITARPNGGGDSLRTLLQNVEVLNSAGAENNRPVVNLLVRSSDVDNVGLADSSARIRLALRNPNEPEGEPRPAISAANLLATPPPPRPGPGGRISPVVPSAAPGAAVAAPAGATRAALR